MARDVPHADNAPPLPPIPRPGEQPGQPMPPPGQPAPGGAYTPLDPRGTCPRHPDDK